MNIADQLQSLYLGRRNSTQSEASTSERSTPASTPALLRTRDSSAAGSYSYRERSSERPTSSLGLRAVSQDRFEEEEELEPVVIAPWPRSISFTSTLTFPPVKRLATKFKKRILVTGGAGFVGSHLVDRLMCSGHDVVSDHYQPSSRQCANFSNLNLIE